MERDLTPREDRTSRPDDVELGALVRAVAEDWRRPPQRLDQPTWLQRVEVSRRSSPSSGGRRWMGRLAQAAVLAFAATMVGAIGAVFLTSPSRNGGIGSNPSTMPTQGTSPSSPAGTSSAAPAGSPLPALYVNGKLPSVTNVLTQGSEYRIADLATGELAPSLPWQVGGWNSPLPRPGGGWVCVCGTYTAGKGGSGSDELVITLKAIDAVGNSVGESTVRTLLSDIDPSQPLLGDSMSLDIRAFSSPDGRQALIGWSERSTTGWHAGVDVVDLASLQVVDRQALPDVAVPEAAQGRTRVRLAPQVDTVGGVGTALISQDWFVEDAATDSPPQGTDRWSATYVGGVLGEAVSAGSRTDHACYEWEHGLIDDTSFYVACIRSSSGVVRVERYAIDGAPIDQAEVGQSTGYGAFAARLDHRLFLWDPQSHTLRRYDLLTGTTSQLEVPDTAGLDGPLDVASAVGRAIGSWLAPSATAKNLLQPAMVVSPDGTRLYAIGIEATPTEIGGSSGVFAFDISGDAIVLVGHWSPTADYVSVAISSDGAFVYAAGTSGVNAEGRAVPSAPSSITVFDARDGSIRLIAGDLGTENTILFTGPVLR